MEDDQIKACLQAFAESETLAECKQPRITPLGDSSLLFEAQGAFTLHVQRRIWSLAKTVSRWPDVRETCPGVTNLMILTHQPLEDLEELIQRLERSWFAADSYTEEQRRILIPVIYDGPDLDFVAESCGISRDDVIAKHSGRDYVVFAVGSHPGFGYLGPLDESLAMSRRPIPRISMPSGSVSIAGLQTGVSASNGPTGWHVIGRTEVTMFDASRTPPSLLQPGDVVRFLAGKS